MYLMCIKRVVNLSTKQKFNSVFCADDMDVCSRENGRWRELPLILQTPLLV